ncbi:MAG: hypothetical protein ACK5Y2_05385 [Bdellovibrionales bacterium]
MTWIKTGHALKRLFVFLILLEGSLSLASVEPARPLQIGFITKEKSNYFDEQVRPYWNQLQAESGRSKLELIPLSATDEKGRLQLADLAERIRQAPTNMKTFYVHWNQKYDDSHQVWLSALQEKIQAGARVAFFAGLADEKGRQLPLRQTFAAQVPKALILGELVDRERLPAQHFYGPELFSAFKDPATSGQGLSPLTFVSRWAEYKPNTDLDTTLADLRKKKAKSRRMWPTPEEFFGR